MSVSYSIVDVFTRQRFGGNPVAVIHDGRGLDDATMQAIAREFGFSETTFVLPPETTSATARVRIFTPHDEIPFAGHPNVGTAFVIAQEETAAHYDGATDMRFEELGGPVAVRVLAENGSVCGAEITAPQGLEMRGPVDIDLMARCLGLDADRIVTDRVAPCVASVGLPFAYAELTDRETLAAIVPDIAAFREAAERGPATVDGFAVCAFLVDGHQEKAVNIRSRVLSPLGHPPEDPATGNASGALAALLAGALDATTFEIMQGVEMGRPSEITVRIDSPDQPPRIEGHCVPVSTGIMLV